jgi:hypothetical protein
VPSVVIIVRSLTKFFVGTVFYHQLRVLVLERNVARIPRPEHVEFGTRKYIFQCIELNVRINSACGFECWVRHLTENFKELLSV